MIKVRRMKFNSPIVFHVLSLTLFLFYNCNTNNVKNHKYKHADYGGTNDLGFSNDYIFNDGEYCAEVLVYNPNTSKNSNYKLTVRIQDNHLIKIYYPNGGWLDNSHFEPPKTNDNQIYEFTDDRGYEYTVAILNDVNECNKVTISDDDNFKRKDSSLNKMEVNKKSLFEYTRNEGLKGVSPTIKKSKEIYNPLKNNIK